MNVCMKGATWEPVQVKCGVVEWVKRNTLRWSGHTERMNSEELVKKVYVSEIKGPSRKGRPLGRWEDRVREYVSEKGATRGKGIEQTRRECWNREGWGLF